MFPIQATVPQPQSSPKQSRPIDVSYSQLIKNIAALHPDVQNQILASTNAFIPASKMVQDLFIRQAKNQPDDTHQAVDIHLLTQHTSKSEKENNRFLRQSLQKNHTPLFDALLKHSATPDLPPLVQMAALQTNKAAFQKLLTQIKHPLPESTLRYVADCGEPDYLRQIFKKISSGLTPDAEQELLTQAENQQEQIEHNRVLPAHQKEALLLAACMGPPEGVQANILSLIRAGANPNAANLAGQTPLHWASQRGQSAEILESLIQAGAEVDAANLLGFTPLMLAAQHGKTAVAQTLIEAGADLNATNAQGATAATLATNAGNQAMIDTLTTPQQ